MANARILTIFPLLGSTKPEIGNAKRVQFPQLLEEMLASAKYE